MADTIATPCSSPATLRSRLATIRCPLESLRCWHVIAQQPQGLLVPVPEATVHPHHFLTSPRAFSGGLSRAPRDGNLNVSTYITGDDGFVDEDGYLFIMGRTDDVINVVGHRLSTGELEEVIATHSDVAECAVIGVADEIKGQVPVGFVVLKAGVTRQDKELRPELVALLRDRVGAVASFKQAFVVDRLPKTARGRCCGRRCATSLMAASTPSRPPSRIRRSSARSRAATRRSP
jgi:propionyl-CoA synthetase